MLRFILIVCFLATPILGYSSGAPAWHCSNILKVGHNAKPKTSINFFSLFGENSVKSGEKIKITLSGDDFLGYVIQAHNDKQEPVGTFEILDPTRSQLLECLDYGVSFLFS